MAGLCWMVLVLVFSLSAGHTEAMDQNRVTKIVQYIRNKYFIENQQFSLAVNIPVNQNLMKLQELFNDDNPDTVKTKVKNKEVYESKNMVEAIPLKESTKDKHIFTEHAEARVLEHMQLLAKSSEDKTLVFYSYLSPCGKKCANPNHKFNILDKINNIPNDQWVERVFVFSKLYNNEEKEFKDILKYLGKTKFCRENIFRCDYYNGQFQCIKCFSNKSTEPVEGCVD